jgi:hypothetical protein
MHFDTKSYLKSTHNHTVKHVLRSTVFLERERERARIGERSSYNSCG